MTKCFSLALLLASIWTTRLLVQGSLQVQELSAMPCRIMGVTLVEKKTGPQLNFTEAQEACRLMGLTLASKDQVEAAWTSSFETCSYGWVSDQFVVISRILPNPKCGKNGVGVLSWRKPLKDNSRAYCHNASGENSDAAFDIFLEQDLISISWRKEMKLKSRTDLLMATQSTLPGDLGCLTPSALPPQKDIWINSCSPEIITTKDFIFDTQSATYTTEMDGSDNMHPTLSPGVPYSTKPPPVLASTSPRRRKLICITEVFMETTTASTETESHGEYTSRFKNEGVGFGGVPTALLVLALLFFAAAAGLAICYVKRYVKAFPFTNKNQQKEMIETKVVKEEKADNSNPNEESNKTDKKPEEPKSPPKTTVRCLEAEV